MKMTYRPDIDGLRAIAVLSVIFYHAGIKIFSGGFVGVDVFFVISGYLITTIIISEINSNGFSLAKFYERRIRRIFPALFAVVAFVLIASAQLFNARYYRDISKSVIAATLFISNMLFWRETGYFDKPSELKPLLHTWSLAVEEQFYIFFPLLLLILARYFKPQLKYILVLLTLVSFGVSAYATNHSPSAAFYLAPTRFWELLIGSILALNIIPTRTSKGIRNILCTVGITMVLVSIFLFTNNTPFPGSAALLPTIGTAMVISSGIEGSVFPGRILSLSPIVFIGKISYSLYLWHWPLIVFGKYYSIREMTGWDISAILLATFILSTLSWKFIENPFRSRTFLKGYRIFVYAGSVMSLAIAAAAFIYINNGLPDRYASIQASDTEKNDAEWKKWTGCGIEQQNIPDVLDLCTIGANTQSPVFLYWGDSHAQALASAVDASASQYGLTGYFATTSGCSPLLGIENVERPNCVQFTDEVISYVENHPELGTVILASRWALYANGTRYKSEDGKNVTLVDEVSGSDQPGPNASLFELGLERTVQKLLELNRKVVIVSGVPEVGYHVPSAYFIAQRTGRDLNNIISPSLNEYLDRNRIVLAVIDTIRSRDAVQVVDPSKVLCDEHRCLVVRDGQPLYRDDDHLSTFGSHFVSHIFDSVFEEMSPQESK